METTKNKPLASPKADAQVGNGMSKREGSEDPHEEHEQIRDRLYAPETGV